MLISLIYEFTSVIGCSHQILNICITLQTANITAWICESSRSNLAVTFSQSVRNSLTWSPAGWRRETGWVRSTANAVFLKRKRSCQQDTTAVLINRAAWLKFTNNNNQSKSSTPIARRQTRLCLCTHNRTPLNLLINWPCLLSLAIYYAKPPQPVDEKSSVSHESINFHSGSILNW